MIRTLLAGLLAGTLIVAHFEGRVAAQAGAAAQKKVDDIFSAMASPGAPGFAVLVRQNGKKAFERGYGVRAIGGKAAIDARTNFRLASFTKQFTAMGVMLLVHDGKLRYDETLTELFPDFPAYGESITVRNLLNHTSGLRDYEDLMDAAEKASGPKWSAEKQIQDAEVLELLKKEKSGKFKPGTSWAYSNSGYVVLGLIVAKASGKSYGEFLRERIFTSLKMDHTIAYEKGRNEMVNRAYGTTKENGAYKETDQSATSATLGDGGIYSNLEDLAQWDDALANHTLVSETEMRPALTPARLNDGSATHWPDEINDDNLHPGQSVSYGFGWFLDPYEGRTRMWHTGSSVGFFTVIERFPSDNLTVIILSNRTDWDREKVAIEVADIFSGARR